jgi:galactose mutarotase-like enzyme
MNYVIKNEYYTATVNGVGAELISVVTAGGREVMWQSPSEDFWSKHAPLLFPICGQLKDKKYTYRGKSYDMKGHGFIGGENFELVESGEDYVVLRSVASEDTLKKYPFDYSFVARYALEGKRVVCTVTI